MQPCFVIPLNLGFLILNSFQLYLVTANLKFYCWSFLSLFGKDWITCCLFTFLKIIFKYFMLIKLHFILSAVLKTCGFKIIWSQHLVKQLWPPDGCRRTEGVCQHFLQRKVIAFYNSTRKKFEIDWFKRMMMKRGKVDKQGESMVASYR